MALTCRCAVERHSALDRPLRREDARRRAIIADRRALPLRFRTHSETGEEAVAQTPITQKGFAMAETQLSALLEAIRKTGSLTAAARSIQTSHSRARRHVDELNKLLADDDEDIARLRFIRRARQLGFTLDDIRALMQLDGAEVCGKAQDLTSAQGRKINGGYTPDSRRDHGFGSLCGRACARGEAMPGRPHLSGLQ
jgi:hypothetical protein